MTTPREPEQFPDFELEETLTPVEEEWESETEEEEEEDESPRKSPALVRWSLGGLLLLGLGGGIGYAWNWVHNSLGPTVAEALSQTINRPLEIGPVERVTLNSIRFGPSGLPATSTDRDRATVEAVEVTFNPVDVIDNEINLNITLINPRVYLEENEQREWMNLEITEEEPKEGEFKINVVKAGARNATVELVPWKGDAIAPEDKVTLTPIRADAEFFDEYNRIAFDGTVSQASTNGEVQAKGEFLNEEQRARVQVRSRNFDLTPFARLVPDVPPEVTLTSGKLNGNVSAQVNVADIPASSLYGTLLVSELAGEYTLPEAITVSSDSTESDSTSSDESETSSAIAAESTESTEPSEFDITKVPLYLSQGNLSLKLEEQLVIIEQNSAIAYADTIPIQLEGGIHLEQGIQVIATLPPVAIETLAETIQTPLPVPASGEFQVKAKVEGPFDNPAVIGLFETTKPTQIDRLEFTSMSTEFAYLNSVFAIQNLKLAPTVGGEILGRGELQLPVTAPTETPASEQPVNDSVELRGASEPPVSNASTPEAESAEVQTEPAGEGTEEAIPLPSPEVNPTPATVPAPPIAITPAEQPFLALEIQGENLPVAALAGLYDIPTNDVNLGLLSPQIQVLGPINQLEAIAKTSMAGGEVQMAGRLIGFDPLAASAPPTTDSETSEETATVPPPPEPLEIQAELRASNIQLAELSSLVPPQLAVPFTGGAQVIVPLDNFTPDRLRGQGEGQLQIAGGSVKVSGRLQDNRIAGLVQADGVQVGEFRSDIEQMIPPDQFQLPFAESAPVTGMAEFTGPVDNLNPNAFEGRFQGTMSLVGGEIAAGGVLQGGELEAAVQLSQVEVARLSPQLQSLATEQPILQTPITATANVKGPIDNLSPNAIIAEVRADLDVAGGRVNVLGQAINGGWKATLRADAVQVEELSSEVPAGLNLPFSGIANAEGRLDDPSPNSIRADVQGVVNAAGGLVNIEAIAQQGEWQGRAQAEQLQLQPFGALLPPDVQPLTSSAQLTGVANAKGRLEDLSPQSIVAQAQGKVNIGSGSVDLEAIAERGEWQARGKAEQIQLGQLGLELPPELQPLTSAAQFVAKGRVDNFDPSAVEAKAELLLSKLPVLERGPFQTQVAWNGTVLAIEEASAPGLQASGAVFPDLQNPLASRFDIRAMVKDFNLASLPIELPEGVNVGGLVGFDGRIAGVGLAPNLDGQVRLQNLAVNELTFDPLIEGPVQYTPDRGATIALKGESDEISAVIDSMFIPQSFTFKVADAVATGVRSPGQDGSGLTNFQVDVAQFPLDLVNLIPIADNPLGPVFGQLSGNFDLSVPTDFTNFDPMAVVARGEIQVDKPKIGTVEGESLAAKLSYAQGQGQLTDTELAIGESKYQVDGAVDLTNLTDPQFNAEVQIAQGSVQDVLQVLQIFDLADIANGFVPPAGRAADLGVLTSGTSQGNLETQLRRFSEILRLQELRQRERDRYPIPALAKLQGAFDGDIKVSGSLNQGLSADIDLLGENWVWGDYSFNPIIVKGSLKDNVLTLLPVQINSNEGLITFSGQVGGEEQSGQLKVEDVPVGLIQQFIPDLPVDVTGTVNTTATLLGGSLENPKVIGNVSLADGTLNEAPIQEAIGNFSLTDGRLRFGGKMLVTGESPITLTGSIPSPLPVGSVSPISQDIQLDLNLENDGLAILNVLTLQQLNWISGTGNVNIKVSGTVDHPIAVGEAAIANATLESELLSESVNNVNGTIRFDGTKVIVDRITGDFSKGTVNVAGLIPLENPNLLLSEEEENNRLRVSLADIDFNFQDIYNGGVNGEIQIAGSALEPVVSGNVRLTQGKISVNEANKFHEENAAKDDTANTNQNAFIPIFRGFEVDLTNGIAILQPGFVDIRGQGTLEINGPLDDLEADGEIALERGFINIISTQFRLNREYDHRVRFNPTQGLDPDLDLQLEASISETQGTRQAESLFGRQPEIDDTPPIDNNDAETVRIQASVTGPASQLENNLELTSSPVRSRSEIIALIGGGVLNTFAGGNTTLALANLAGTTILSNLQSSLGEALGLTEFRLYPTEDSARQGNLGLAGEATLDVTKKFSTSLGKTLTSSDPARLRFRYRLSESLVLRGATDLGGESSTRRQPDSRIQFEFRKRF
ncbi:translocation/assembly module TamB domain-containing protein [Roseofilum casamattae]|uniref:Translocation/assembly module TamB domain-containing protein n=1 Tax=Roseofilum casamattae BLCC-M143 TaxID=3022442 RepID=A0ABT7BZ51_9CYAN|nr:translocation/assembly module TamB domain-containing protein [Roseofilum casamattae]MDJ1184072.1 translocation/assembly module TamB domain-containing protein [Roseofilum casamattae BLCC-M143]